MPKLASNRLIDAQKKFLIPTIAKKGKNAIETILEANF